MRDQVYLASEDSALLRGVLTRYHGENCLEIGAGNAGNLVDLSVRFQNVVGTDLVRPSMADWRRRGVSFVLADAASCMRQASFDLVAFNPPYLKEESGGDPAVEGGSGLEVPRKFLAEALRVVKTDGKVVMLVNGEAEVSDLQRELARSGFRMRKVATRHLFFENLSVYEASAADGAPR